MNQRTPVEAGERLVSQLARAAIPDQVLESDLAVIARKGAGKSYLLRGLVERNLSAGRPTVILDPMEIWWGLKQKADGSPGYPIPVIGGGHADLPLDPSRGPELARFLAEREASAVVDVSDLKRDELLPFATAFLEELYRLNRKPLWLVLEEADVFAPQNPASRATREMHDEVDRIVRRGRAFGFRVWTATQRPARLSKDVLTQTETLFLLQLSAPQDTAAAREWIRGHAEPGKAAEVEASLASLEVGEGWMWSPRAGLLERMKFPPIATLDTGFTPKAGERRRQAGQLAQVDVAALKAALGGQGGVKLQVPATPGEPITVIGAAELQEAEDRGFARGLAEGGRREWKRAFDATAAANDRALAALKAALDEEHAELLKHRPSDGEGTLRRAAATAPPMAPAAKAPAPPAVGSSQPRSAGGADRLLEAIRSAPHRPLRWNEVSVLATLAPTAGYTRKAINDLRASGRIVETLQGVDLAPGADAATVGDAAALVDAWATKVGGAGARILRHLYVMGAQTQAEVAESIGLSSTAGYTRVGWKCLRNAGLIEETGQRWQLCSILRELKEAGGG